MKCLRHDLLIILNTLSHKEDNFLRLSMPSDSQISIAVMRRHPYIYIYIAYHFCCEHSGNQIQSAFIAKQISYSAGRRSHFGTQKSFDFVRIHSIIDQLGGSRICSLRGKQFVGGGRQTTTAYTDCKGTWHTFLSRSHQETIVLSIFLLLDLEFSQLLYYYFVPF